MYIPGSRRLERQRPAHLQPSRSKQTPGFTLRGSRWRNLGRHVRFVRLLGRSSVLVLNSTACTRQVHEGNICPARRLPGASQRNLDACANDIVQDCDTVGFQYSNH